MFDRQQELEKAQGYRGPATRFFGPIDDVSEAASVLRDMCLSLFLLAGLLLASSIRAGLVAVAASFVIAVPAALLLFLRSRPFAVALLIAVAALSTAALVLGWIRGIFAILFWVCVLQVAGRASRAAFKLHEFSAPCAAAGIGDGV
jgi:hypothetical protein